MAASSVLEARWAEGCLDVLDLLRKFCKVGLLGARDPLLWWQSLSDTEVIDVRRNVDLWAAHWPKESWSIADVLQLLEKLETAAPRQARGMSPSSPSDLRYFPIDLNANQGMSSLAQLYLFVNPAGLPPPIDARWCEWGRAHADVVVDTSQGFSLCWVQSHEEVPSVPLPAL